ncbi:hypothetical protein ACHAPT_013043 [Fusarium lateritium]
MNEGGDPPGGDSPPPSAFLQAKHRTRWLHKVKGHRSNASVASGETATDGACLHADITQLSEPVDQEANLETAPRETANVQPVEATVPETAHDTADVDSTDEIFPPDPFDDAQGQLAQRSAEDVIPLPRQSGVAAATAELPNLTQNNSQYNINTYNVSYTSNNYFDGGGGGGRWRALGLSPYCAFPLVFIVICLLVLIAAVYGAATFWNNTVSTVQGLLSAVSSFVTLGFLTSTRPTPTGQAGGSPTITIITPTMTAVPTPIIHSPSGVIKAVDDLDHWVKLLKGYQGTGEQTAEHRLFFEHFDVSLSTIGGVRDGWVVVMEDILTLEKKLRNTFSPLNRDIAKLRRDLGASPAAKRWMLQVEASTWDKLLSSMPWISNKSPVQVLIENHERAKALSARVQKARKLFAHQAVRSIQQRVESLSDGSCRLRDSIEIGGEKVPRNSDEKLSEGVVAVMSRGNLLCNLIRQAEKRIQRLGQVFDNMVDDPQTIYDLEVVMSNLARLKSVSLQDVKMIEQELQQWVGKISGPVKQLHFIDLDS